jgi:hypothetical protein
MPRNEINVRVCRPKLGQLERVPLRRLSCRRLAPESRRPTTREEALDLARAHQAYCNDVIDQDVGSYRALAAGLMAIDWWSFWWD